MGFSQSLKHFFGFDLPTVEKNTSNSPATSDELVHINQEMYKKSAELSDKNKTLSLLQNLNELLLGSITSIQDIAKQVTQLLVHENDFLIAALLLYDKNTKSLQSTAITQNIQLIDLGKPMEISLSEDTNLIVQAIKSNQTKFTNSFANVFPASGNTQEVKSIFIAPLFVRDEIIGALVIAMNEEEKDMSEHRLDLLNRVVGALRIGIDNALLYQQVEDSNVRLKELDKLKNEFVSVASHELRTPMTAIKSYLWMALEGKGGALTEKQKYYIQRGYNSVDRLIRLVNDMLNISRIESGKISIELQSVDLVKMTQEVVDEVLLRAKEVGVTIEMQKLDTLPRVFADSDKIKEVLFNLIGNSLKFTPKGGTITISFFRKDDFIETSIADTGAGISIEDSGKLFQKFGLLPGSYITNQTSTQLGTGLGLYICKSIINLHHGEIKAESEGRGKGSTFSFTLKVFDESDMKELKKENPQEKKDTAELIHAGV
jgi:signal transduction histidine kinase